MIDTSHNTGDSAAAFILSFFGGIFARLIDMHFFETILLALFCGFLGTFAKNAGAFAWKLCAEYYHSRKTKGVPKMESPPPPPPHLPINEKDAE
ncbi:MAG: hypothetical protein U0T77_10760 [Chitinophagales bacterium]